METLDSIILSFSSILLCVITYLLKRTADLQFVMSLMAAFQNEWHSRITILMLTALRSDFLKKAFNEAIEEAYGCSMNYQHICRLLNSRLRGNRSNEDRLRSFEQKPSVSMKVRHLPLEQLV